MVLRVAHRGASAYALENTLEAFEKAIELKADMIEFDVHLTKDKEVVIMHDKSLDKTTNGKGLIKNLTLKQIRKFHEKNNEKIPILQDALDVIKGRCSCIIELKDSKAADKVAKTVKENNLEKNAMILSPDVKTLKKIKESFPELNTWLLVIKREPIDNILSKAKSVNVHSISAPYNHITKEIVDLIHKNKLKANVWTVNTKNDIEMMKKLNVDSITSDYPDRI
jgi:glycerophosphoryl diester phosphodiesterase